MDENNVKKGEIRLEDSFYEAKIHEPIPPGCIRYHRYAEVEQNDSNSKTENLLPIQRTGEEYREG